VRRTARDSEESARKITRRGLFLGGAMVGYAAVLGMRMRYMQVEKADEFRLLAEENRVNIRLIPPARGLILDREGRLIAGNEQNYRVVVTREDAGDVDEVMARLSHIIPMTAEDYDRTMKEIRRHSAFVPVVVADRLSWDDFSKIAINSPTLPGVSPEVGLSRSYPLVEDFAHVVGYVGPVSEKDLEALEKPDPLLQIPKFQIGKIGVEKWMEDTLRGTAGNRKIEVNSVGRVMRELERVEGTPGADIRLTIDAGLQNFVQARLLDQSAACVIMDVNNGDILACVSAPSFDPNLFVRGISSVDYSALMEDDHRPLANKTVQGVYPPGSTFKMVTALAALSAGVITVDTRVRCPGYIEYGGRRFHCWKRGGHGSVGPGTVACRELRRLLLRHCPEGRHRQDRPKWGCSLAWVSAMTCPCRPLPRQHAQQAMEDGAPQAGMRIGDTINASIGQGLCAVFAAAVGGDDVTHRLGPCGRATADPVHRRRGAARARCPAAGGRQLDPRTCPPWHVRGVNGAHGTAKGSRIVEEAMLMAGKTGTSQVRNISAAERARGVGVERPVALEPPRPRAVRGLRPV
jgi:penicillin-binding protein 2